MSKVQVDFDLEQGIFLTRKKSEWQLGSKEQVLRRLISNAMLNEQETIKVVE